MTRKIFGLAPLLAIVVFAMPTAAQAKPHWFTNTGSRLAEKVQFATIAWGTGTNLKQESAAGEINCKTVGAGFIENPLGTTGNKGASGPAGQGQAQAASFYECKAPECEAKVKKAVEKGELPPGVVGVGQAVGQNFPWHEELNESNPAGGEGEFGKQIGVKGNGNYGAGFPEGYPAAAQAANGKGTPWGEHFAIGAIVICELSPNLEGAAGTGLPPRVLGEISFEGEQKTSIGGGLNNVPTTSVPAEYQEVGAASGALPSNTPGVEGIQTGKIKYMGYNNTPYKVEGN